MPAGAVTEVYLLLEGGHRIKLQNDQEGVARSVMANPSGAEQVSFKLASGGQIILKKQRIVALEIS